MQSHSLSVDSESPPHLCEKAGGNQAPCIYSDTQQIVNIEHHVFPVEIQPPTGTSQLIMDEYGAQRRLWKINFQQ